MEVKVRLLLILLLSVDAALCAPWLDLWFPQQSSYDGYRAGNGPTYRQHRQGRGGKARWKQICRTINPDPFAFAGRAPYPAAPVCPW